MTDQPNKVWLSFERKYNVAEYESLAVMFGGSIEVKDGETHKEAALRLHNELEGLFHRVARRQLKKAIRE